MKNKKKVGLALGGGLARGLAHIGVLKGLEDEGIVIDYIAGTSMGSVVAGLYACGLKIEMLEKLAKRITRRKWMAPTFPKMGLMSGDKIEEILLLLTGKRNFEDLKIPLAIVAMDITKGEKIIIQEGSVAKAIRASCAIPGIFTPVNYNDMLLVDGGVLSNVPVEAVRFMGADKIIAVDVTSHTEDYKIENIFDVLTKTIEVMAKEITRNEIAKADVVIRPDMRGISPSDFDASEEAIKRGRQAFLDELSNIKKMIK